MHFNEFSYQDFLKRLSLILVGRETKRGQNHITFVEPARRQTAQHGAHIMFAQAYLPCPLYQ